MSEKRKLEQQFIEKMGRHTTMADFIVQWGKLVEKCPHTKTHWIQEIDSEGLLKGYLKKRCYLCGINIEYLDVDEEFKEKLLADFDKACEEKKLLITPIKGQG